MKMDAQHQQPTLNQLQDRVQALTQENLHLRDNNERLFTKVGYLESRLGHLASSNTDLSCRLVQSEEERLKISKELVEEKIQTNKMREQYEEETFELKNKILNQDGVITELQMQRDKLLQELQSAEARLKVTEKSGQDLTEDYATLKNSYLVLTEAHDKELAQSEELSAELLALARNQDALRRQLEEQQQSVKTTTQGLHGELDRVRALISRMSHNRVKPEDLAALDKEQKTMEKTLLGNQDEIKETLEKMKNSYEEQQKKLEEKVVAMSKEQQQNNRAMHVSQQKLSEQSAALVCSQSQMKEVEEENSKLQLQVKELHEEYRARLVCYLQDLADYIDGLKDSKSTSEHSKMRTFVDSMLQDVRSSYRAREEQLASAARSYKKRLQKITKTHHALLIAYRVQRAQILTSSETSLDPGPPEANFSLEPTELRDETEKELQQLRQDKARLEGQLQMAASKMPVQNSSRQEQPGQICEESWLDMKKQLREITDSTLVDFERERALLVTRATVAEAQVMELQDYVDDHLSRYKQEITHLHRLHGMEEAGHSQSAHSSHH
ncbi:coiled-coil domain-containing protein 78 isoform X1 [Acanthochromis polyacanthus]|uniref:coiled-coil domain-containing protein 78 isoform X1 n=1 Tax=Acanthochromis polyacanthus TaxID=80966 RepID=UPI000B8FA30F|nr:coiled-coil domain-containing protein 78 isoform X1 [Acanthochromis polyacanthus]